MSKKINKQKYRASFIVNLIAIVLILISVIAAFFPKVSETGVFSTSGLQGFRYFTIDSNILAALSSIFVAIYAARKTSIPHWAEIFKFVGTVSVAVTLVTVLLFLGPTIGYDAMLSDENLFLHLINPLLCIVSLLFYDPISKIKFSESLFGVLPVIIYGVIYFFAVMIFQFWPDFYGFNAGDQWYVSAIIMSLGTFCLSSLIWFLLKKTTSVS